MMLRWISTIRFLSIFLIAMMLSCIGNKQRGLNRVYPLITLNIEDSCTIESLSQLNLFVFSKYEQVIEVSNDKKKIGSFELLGNTQKEYHYILNLEKDQITDSIIISNLSSRQYFIIPYNKDYDAIGMGWQDSIIEINYTKSCSFIP